MRKDNKRLRKEAVSDGIGRQGRFKPWSREKTIIEKRLQTVSRRKKRSYE